MILFLTVSGLPEGALMRRHAGGIGCGARGRESRPAATMSRPPGAWLSGADRPPCASPKTRSQGGSNGRSLQSAARRSKEDAAMARHEAPASLERERGTERTMVAPPGAPSPSRFAWDEKDDGVPG